MFFDPVSIKSNARSFFRQNTASSIGVQVLYIAVSVGSSFALMIAFFILFSIIAVATAVSGAGTSAAAAASRKICKNAQCKRYYFLQN